MAVKICPKGTSDTIEYLITWSWNNDEYFDDAKNRAVVVAALKLACWRKYPILRNWRILRFFSGAWYELTAFFAYERGEYFTDFEKRALCKLGCKEVFMKFDYYGPEPL